MNAPLRSSGARPTINVDTWGFRLFDPSTGTVVGRHGPLSRGRVVSALRLGEFGNSQTRHVRKPTTIVDTWGFSLVDPTNGTIVGRPGISVQRMLTARWVEDTYQSRM
jgi:hypothetical protein